MEAHCLSPYGLGIVKEEVEVVGIHCEKLVHHRLGEPLLCARLGMRGKGEGGGGEML